MSVKKNTNVIVFSTTTGLKIVSLNDAVMFELRDDKMADGACWGVLLKNREFVYLKKTTTSQSILKSLGERGFFKVNAKQIVNLMYIDHVHEKLAFCILKKPFQNIEMNVNKNVVKKVVDLWKT